MGGEKNLMFFGVYTPISFRITHNPRGLLGKLHLKKGRLRGGLQKEAAQALSDDHAHHCDELATIAS
jgi:hypothetical protein